MRVGLRTGETGVWGFQDRSFPMLRGMDRSGLLLRFPGSRHHRGRQPPPIILDGQVNGPPGPPGAPFRAPETVDGQWPA